MFKCGIPKCFKCEKEIRPACEPRSENDIWKSPCAVLLQGGSNFGSTLYDSFVDGIAVQVIICDDCIKTAQGTDRLREVKLREKKYWEVER
jgi:hypothetical protein